MVHLFDQIVKTIPAGARLTSLKQQGDKLTLNGVAQSNATVADYMRSIEASPWMGQATLVKTENVHTDSNTPYEFELVVTLRTPKNDGSGGTPAPGSSASSPAPSASVTSLPAQTATAMAPAAATTAATSAAPKASPKPVAGTSKGGARP
ncbi:MAG: PilN domain-containing protein, partial [Xanthomonadaceae bacterium]|nr:PilN domain-containing protein [Xanthomonadaceae bacterium]